MTEPTPSPAESAEAVGASSGPGPSGLNATEFLLPMQVAGLYARTHRYIQVVDGIERYLSTVSNRHAEKLRFPPVMSRDQIVRSGYLGSFPQLLGCLCALHGSEGAMRQTADRIQRSGDWTGALEPSDMVLIPAACYPVYPLAAARGRIPRGGLLFDVEADCFRHEPSCQPERLQSFRMREFVRIGSADEAFAFRQHYMSRAMPLAATLGLSSTMDVASDPFFGRLGLMMAVSQRQQALKYELCVPNADGQPIACMSFNYHGEHFGRIWELRDAHGGIAHTACVAFGVDRLSLALFARHGRDLDGWPAETRRALGF